MNELIDSLINGNLKDAKERARCYPIWKIRKALVDCGYSLEKATLTSDWLHGRDCWQAACDAK